MVIFLTEVMRQKNYREKLSDLTCPPCRFNECDNDTNGDSSNSNYNDNSDDNNNGNTDNKNKNINNGKIHICNS